MVITEKGIHATKWPHSAQEACPAGHIHKNKLQNRGVFLDTQKAAAKSPHQPHKLTTNPPRSTTTNHRKISSNTKESSVFSSRYLTITGAAKLNPHSAPFPFEIARDPGTTTAPSGITSGISAVAL
jgi:hypothetical protein